MKKIFFGGLILIGLFILPNFSQAEAINSFRGSININPDASISVTENIKYDFGNTQHHGIYRYLPVAYNFQGKKRQTKIKVISVTDANNHPYHYQTSIQGDKENIIIGNPNYTLNGVHTYIIRYNVQNVINPFKDHDELYWNFTGNDWSIPISNVKLSIELPKKASSSEFKLACYSGLQGSRKTCDSHQVLSGKAIFSENYLPPKSGLSVVLGFPKGLVSIPAGLTDIEKANQTDHLNLWKKIYKAIDKVIIFLPLLVLFLMIFLWFKKGRDPSGFSTIIAQYQSPKDLSPAETGAIVKKKVLPKYISAEIINLAVLGYLKITHLQNKTLGFIKKSDYQLDLLKKGDSNLNDFQNELLDDLFKGENKIMISELKQNFKTKFTKLSKLITEDLIAKKYFPDNFGKIKKSAKNMGVILIFLGFSFVFSYHFNLALIFSGIIILIFSFFLNPLSFRGAKTKQYILGLKLYLSVAEKDRLKFFDAPEANPKDFEKLLPYAMVLGVANEWAKKFQDIYKEIPTWYNDSQGGAFNTILFVSSISAFSMASTSAIANNFSGGAASGNSGFGGGGFSGGGFGGGGGGSW